MSDTLRRFTARRLRELRRDAGMPQARLAEKAGVSTEFISRLERAKTLPSLPTLMRLCEALQCTPNDVLLSPRPSMEGKVDRLRERLATARPAAAREALRVAEAMLEYAARKPSRRY